MPLRKNALYISPYFWPEEIGSAPYSYDLAKYIDSKGYDVSVVAFMPHYPKIEDYAEWSSEDDLRVEGQISIERVGVSARGTGGFLGRVKNDLGMLFRLLKLAVGRQHTSADVIIAYIPGVLTLFGAKAIKLTAKAPIVGIVHDIESGLANSLGITDNRVLLKFMQLVERVGLNFCDEVIVLTEGMKLELESIGCTAPIMVLPIWSEVWAYNEIDVKERMTVMYSGNFGKKQNLDQLLPLFSKLEEGGRGPEIIMRGGGSERIRIENEVKARGLSNLRFAPLAPADQFVQSLQSANVHLVPQAMNVANYALPSKLISIMAAGRPYVCIAEKGSPLERFTIDSKAGICVHPGDELGLYEAVDALLNDIEMQRAMGKAGRDFVSKKFSRQKILNSYLDVLQQLNG